MRPILFFSAFAVLMSCQPVDCNNGVQDGNETGIDCGGSCLACNSTGNPTNNTPPADLLKLWHKALEAITLQNQAGGTTGMNSTIHYNSNCSFELTNTEPSQAPGAYASYGSIANCSYPTPNYYYYNSVNNSLSGLPITLLTSDSLIFGGSSGGNDVKWHYSSSQLTAPSQESIQWSVELESAYPNNGEVSINIWVNNTLVSTVPVVSGQLIYNGTQAVNLSFSQPKIFINVNTSVTSQAVNTISFSKKLSRNGLVLSKTGVGTYAVGTGNIGYDPLVGGAPCMITWE